MNANQQASLANIEAQAKHLLGVDVKVRLESEEIDQRFGVAIRSRFRSMLRQTV